MDKLDIEGGEFVKAKAIAREFGYTADYIGQLCRAGKIEGKLVGRTWYINKKSLIEHKNNRYKNTPSDKSEDKKAEERPNFYTRATAVDSVSYDTDETDLIPNPHKLTYQEPEKPIAKLSIGLADAENLNVKSNSEYFAFETPEPKQPIFKGDLVVSALPEIDFDEQAGESSPELNLDETEDLEVEATGGSRKTKVKIRRLNQPKEVFKRRVESQVVASKTATGEVAVAGDTDETAPQTVSMSYLATSAVFAGLVVLSIFSIESTTYITDQVVLSEINIRAGELLAAVYGSK